MFQLSNSKHPNLAKIYLEARDLYRDLPIVKQQRRKEFMYRTFKTMAYVCLALIGLVIILLGAQILTFKSVVSQALAGKSNLEDAAQQVREENFREAILAGTAAEENFHRASSDLGSLLINPTVKYIPGVQSQIKSLQYLAQTGEMLSRTVIEGSSFGADLKDLIDPGKNLTYSTLSKEEKKRILGRIYQSGPDLIGIKADLDLAVFNLNQVTLNGVLWPLKNTILDLRNKLGTGTNLLTQAIPLSQIMPALAGYPEKSTFLVLLQNSDELRPTGGFIGTYGILEIEYGDIIRFETHDIYHMDMPVKDAVVVEPPTPIKLYLNPRWYMRDANWSPDWPTAAKQVMWFYEKENKLLPPKDQINKFDGQFAGVIGITPKFVTDLLAMVGPIRMGEETYTDKNFVDLLQYKVERGFEQVGTPSWQRKEVIGDILKELKLRLMDLPSDTWPEVSRILDMNLAKKNILLYHQNQIVESQIQDQNWGGEVKEVNGDYLQVIDTNMASLKTDAVMSRGIEYSVEQRPQGIYAKLRINYAHRGKPDWKTSNYKAYTRVYVPEGSKLIRSEGNFKAAVEAANELGKTYFGALINIEPQSVGSLYFEYKLPDRLATQASAGHYQLYAAKQPGSVVDELKVDFRALGSIKSYSPVGFSVTGKSKQQLLWTTDLTTDKEFKVKFDY